MRDLNDTQAKALGQNWTLVKTVEADMRKMHEKMEKDLEVGLKISCEQLTKDVTTAMNQLGEMCDATKGVTEDLSKEIAQMQKSMKGGYSVFICSHCLANSFTLLRSNTMHSAFVSLHR